MLRLPLCLALAGLLLAAPAAAQLTIPEDAFTNLDGRSFAEQSYLSTDTDAAAALANQDGPNQTWDLTKLTFDEQGDPAIGRFTSAPETLPEADDPGFDEANWGTIRTVNDGTQTESTSFLRLENGVVSVVGDAFFLGGGDVQKTYYTEPRPVFIFPLAYEDTWAYDGQVTYSSAPGGTYETTHEVDAYGTLITPAGTFEVLRVFEESWSSVTGSLVRSYSWYPETFEDGPVAVVNCPYFFGFPACSTTYLETAETNTQAIAGDGPVPFGEEMGIVISFDGTNGSGSVTVRRYNTPPTDAGGLPASDLAPYRVIIEADGVTVGPGTEVRFAVSRFGEIVDPDMIEVQSRPVPGQGPFGAHPTRYDAATGTITAEVNSFSEFVFLTDTNPIPVELASFVGTAAGEAVTLAWTTASETNNAGFDVERSLDGRTFIPIGHKTGFGTTTEARRYRFVDADVPFADTLFYRLRQMDLDGTAEYSPVVPVGVAPSRFALLPNAPNPVRGTTQLRYMLSEEATVSLRVYDLLGRRVASLVDAEQRAGRYTVTLDGTSLSSGTYVVRLQADGQTATRRLAVVR
jgi:hypothetical protein